MHNNVSIIGRLRSAPTVNLRTRRPPIAFFFLEVTKYELDNGAVAFVHTIPCSARGRIAEICAEFLVGGSKVAITGELISLEYGGDDMELGKMCVHIKGLEFLSRADTARIENKGFIPDIVDMTASSIVPGGRKLNLKGGGQL